MTSWTAGFVFGVVFVLAAAWPAYVVYAWTKRNECGGLQPVTTGSFLRGLPHFPPEGAVTSHRYHPDCERGDPGFYGPLLFDDCDRCRDHAVAPWASLDELHLTRLREINLGIVTPLTRTERLAANALREYDARVLLGTL